MIGCAAIEDDYGGRSGEMGDGEALLFLGEEVEKERAESECEKIYNDLLHCGAINV